MIVKYAFSAHEAYTHPNWVYTNIFVDFSRLYYVIDGEAYYEENGKKIRLKKNHLYLTPANVRHKLYDNPKDKLLHTFTHVFTTPPINELIEVEVKENTLLADAVALWRKHISSGDTEELLLIIQLILSCIEKKEDLFPTLAQRVRSYLDNLKTFSFSMNAISTDMRYSREHITKSFISYYGITPKKYFDQRRMNAAINMLMSGIKINEIASSLGFSSAYSFSKAFKSSFGVSPKKYRETF